MTDGTVMSSSRHIPVLMEQVLWALAPQDGHIILDATFGAGGYSCNILESCDCTVYGFDRDPRAILAATPLANHYKGRLKLISMPFDQMAQAMAAQGLDKVDGIVFDLGVSSMQLDEADRGFSFRQDGPLSMRMDGGKPDAEDVINAACVEDLREIFKIYGEERRANQLARAIVRARNEKPIRSTKHLAEIIESASPPVHFNNKSRGKSGAKPIHPATRVFQALRIFVNDELGQLARALVAAEHLLREGGRLVVVTFHSLEARIVKTFLNERSGHVPAGSRHRPTTQMKPATFELLFRGQKTPDPSELQRNVRARSAALRAAYRTDIPVWPLDLSFARLPHLKFSDTFLSMETS